MIYKRYNRAITTGMTFTALTLTAAFSPVQAQLNNNAFFPSAPRILAPLGGGILGNQSSFGSPLRNLNPQFNTFGGQLAGFNSNRGAFPNQFVDYNAQLAAFNSQRTAFNSQFDRFTANNVRVADFNTANLNFAADGTFFQSNPSLNPLLVNGPATRSIGFNGFNTFNAMNPSATGFQTFNTLANNFGGAGVPVAAQVQNITRISRAKPAYNPTLPASFVAPFPTAAQLAAASHLNTGLPPVGSDYRIPSATTAPTYPITALPPVGAGYRIPLAGATVTYPIMGLPPVGANYRIPLGSRVMIGGASPAFGMGSGITVMGGRSR